MNETLDMWAKVLLVLGGLNWGLTLFSFNLVTWLSTLVDLPMLETILYLGIGLGAVYTAYYWKRKL